MPEHALEQLLTWLPALAPVLAVLLVGVLHAQRVRCVLRRELVASERRYESLRRDLDALLVCSRGLGERVHAQQQLLRRLGERQTQLEREDASQSRFGAAATLLQRGAEVDEIIDQCGVSRAEAELVLHLQQLRSRGALRSVA
ncbi:MAG: DUF2802 domain-containing protein [Gammaproteobacteria bacterium]|nr:DUF2802 domain-containing protein [Gammaproteobacteria bacterium]